MTDRTGGSTKTRKAHRAAGSRKAVAVISAAATAGFMFAMAAVKPAWTAEDTVEALPDVPDPVIAAPASRSRILLPVPAANDGSLVAPIVTDRFRAMGSDVVAVFEGPEHLSGHAETRINHLEQAWSRFIETSDVSRLNRGGTWQRVSSDTITLFERSFTAWHVTSGAFDPTVLPSLVAAGYGESRSERQGHTVLATPPSRVQAPGMARIEIDATHSRINIPEGIAFDAGGIGKGLAADIVAESLIACGAHAAMISVGGDVRIAGDTPANWTVEVESPFDPDETIVKLHVLAGAVCTTSVRAKTWMHGTESVHHIIDPSTGRSATSSIVSATIVAADAWTAEALCKAAVMTEPLDAIAFCRSLGVEAIIVDVEGVVWTTDAITRFAA